MKLDIKLDFDHGAWSDEEIKDVISDNLKMIPRALHNAGNFFRFDDNVWRELVDRHGEIVGQWRVYK